jgi:hypothetical protein
MARLRGYTKSYYQFMLVLLGFQVVEDQCVLETLDEVVLTPAFADNYAGHSCQYIDIVDVGSSCLSPGSSRSFAAIDQLFYQESGFLDG